MNRFTVDELNDILGDTSWEVFEGRHTGDLFVRLEKDLLGFYMRVGTHFKLPTQVIVADGSFIRMRSAKQYADYPLFEINAKNPEACVYPEFGGSASNKPVWMPWRSDYATASWLMPVVSSTSPNTYTINMPSVATGNTTTILTNAQVQLYQAHAQAQLQQAQVQAAQQYAPNTGLGQGWQGLGQTLGSIFGIK